MHKYRRILVPVHFPAHTPEVEPAPDSREAIDQAIELATELGSSLTFVHVFAGREEPGASSDDGELPAVHEFFDRTVAAVQADGIEARWVFLFGHPSAEIVSMAATEAFDLVMLGTRQQPGQGTPIGSTAAEVMATCGIPVWVARRRGAARGAVVVATDLSARSAPVLLHGACLAAWRGADLHLVHACQCRAASDTKDPQDGLHVCRAKMECEMAGVDLELAVPPYTTHVECAAPDELIWQVASAEHADLVLLGHREHGLVERLAGRGTAEKLFGELPCSLMTVPS